MKKTTEFSINRTLNELLVKILSGVDYVSKIALETGKSVPVVYRQLDILVDVGVLAKKRRGKKVIYEINWINLSEIIVSTLSFDVEKLRQVTKASKKEATIIAEINHILTGVPTELYDDEEKLRQLVKDFFCKPPVLKLLEQFLKDLEAAGKEMNEYRKLAFKKSVDLFIDTIGMMNDKEQKKFLQNLNSYDKDTINFLKFCRLRHLQKQLVDPRKKFVASIFKE